MLASGVLRASSLLGAATMAAGHDAWPRVKVMDWATRASMSRGNGCAPCTNSSCCLQELAAPYWTQTRVPITGSEQTSGLGQSALERQS